MLVKGIKKGKIIEFLEEVNSPDNQEILVEIIAQTQFSESTSLNAGEEIRAKFGNIASNFY